MTESKASARPSQVTMAGWVAVIGSALLVLTLFDSMSQIRSIEMRESIDEFLSTYPGNGLGLDTGEVIEILRVMMLFAGAAAAAATVLAIYVLQRNQAARIGFTIAAVAIMFTAPFTGSPLSVIVAAAAMMLWTRPARDWFAGRSPAPSPQRGHTVSSEQPPSGERPSEHDSGASQWPRMPDSSSDRPAPPPTQGFGSPSYPSSGTSEQQPQGSYPHGAYPPGQQPTGQSHPQPYGQQGSEWPPAYGQQQYGGYPAYQPGDPDRRPTTVTAAAWLTWVGSALMLLAFGLVVLVMLVGRDQLVSQLRQDPRFDGMDVTVDQLIAGMWVVSTIIAIWCVSSIVLAILAYRRQNWARITLMVSCAFVVLFSGIAIASLVSILPLLAAGATIVLLFTGGANDWYRRRPGGFPSYPSYTGQSYGQGGYGQAYGQGYGQQPAQGGRRHDEPGAPDRHGSQGQPESGDKDEPPKNVW